MHNFYFFQSLVCLRYQRANYHKDYHKKYTLAVWITFRFLIWDTFLLACFLSIDFRAVVIVLSSIIIILSSIIMILSSIVMILSSWRAVREEEDEVKIVNMKLNFDFETSESTIFWSTFESALTMFNRRRHWVSMYVAVSDHSCARRRFEIMLNKSNWMKKSD